ncbi:MAG TPA: efflux RND transporter permease subunit [Polyangiaceae bacterium]|jgi:multidrug efflux pump|nr:efflux RND transporter permease subunit [Polyangiaceae bacterium]
MNFTEICIRRPVLAWMLMAGTILFGLVSASRIGVSQMPDVDSPNVTVTLAWPGASPEEIESGIIQPLEESLAQVEGVQRIEATARLGSARLTAIFALNRNIDLALQDVQAKVSQAQRSLPTDVQQPTVSKSNPDDTPLLTVGLKGAFSRQVLSDFARYQVEQKLQTIPGVGQVTTAGYLDRNIRIWVDSSKLVERNVTVSDINNALTKQHVVVPGGQLETPGQDITVQVLGEALDLETFKHIIISDKAGAPIYLQDVALIEDGFEDARTIARIDGVPLQAMSILKQHGTNAVTVASDVRAAVDELKKTLPPGMDIDVLFDTTDFIKESVHEIETELVLAVGLTSLVCWLFLGSFSATLNVLLAIPMSLFGTIAVIWAAGFTLNTFTLLGLSLAIGLVVDDAVMVMENIYRHGEMGKDGFKAALDGTGEITFAALAATAAVIAIFLPVIFMNGVVGRYFFQFGVTLSLAVAISYVEAVTLAPARCARLLAHHGGPESQSAVAKTVDRLFTRLARFYHRALGVALSHPWKVLGISTAVMLVSFAVGLSLPSEFTPPQDQSSFNIRITAPTGSDVEEADREAKKIEDALAKHPEVKSVMANVSPGSAGLTVALVPPSERKLTQQEFAASMRKQFVVPGARVTVQDPSQQGIGSSKGSPIQVSVRGSDWNTLVTQALKVRDELDHSGVATDVDSDYQLGLPEVMVTPDRARTADLGVSIEDLATTINALIGGVVVGKYSSEGRRLDVRMRMLLSQRMTPEDIGEINVRTASGKMVPISSMVTVDEKPVLQSINRIDRERSVSVTANVAPGHSQSEALAYLTTLTKDFPVGYHAVLGGQSSDFQDSMQSLAFALMFGIAVAYMILAAQFDSFMHPVTVLTILPLSVAGAFLGLWAGGKTLSIYSMIGILLLMGITKKNSIILVDYANAVRAEKSLTARDAMLEAGPIRLRPILMTTVATMMAAVPSALGLGAGSETRGPMAIAVLGGLTLSTLLSLLVVPSFYVVTDRIKQRISRKSAPSALEHPPATA